VAEVPTPGPAPFVVRVLLEPDEAADLFRRFHPLIVATAARIVGWSQAEDVAQSIYLAWLERGLARDVDRGPMFAGWIRFQTRMAAIQSVRVRVAEELRDQDPDASWWPWRPSSPLEIACRRELRARLVKAFASLPPRMRTAAQLRFLRGTALADCAKDMGVTWGGVSSLIHHSKQKLRADLADVYEPTGQPTKIHMARRA
jgi:RNA polymerase sigma factor (sigma-70 family)